MRIWMGPLLATLLLLAYLGLAPTEDSSFSCDAPPIVRLFNPEPEVDNTAFFDAGTQCNADARGRARSMGLVALFGSVLTEGTVLVTRRKDTNPGGREVDPVQRPEHSESGSAA